MNKAFFFWMGFLFGAFPPVNSEYGEFKWLAILNGFPLGG